MLIVCNTNDKAFSQSWDSKKFSFPPGEEVEVSEVAASFLFAYGVSDERQRERVLMRNGWLKASSPDDPFGPVCARKMLAGFVFKKAADKTAAKPDTRIRIPAPETGVEEQPDPTPIALKGKKDEATADDLPALGRTRLHLPGSSKAIGPSRLPPA